MVAITSAHEPPIILFVLQTHLDREGVFLVAPVTASAECRSARGETGFFHEEIGTENPSSIFVHFPTVKAWGSPGHNISLVHLPHSLRRGRPGSYQLTPSRAFA